MDIQKLKYFYTAAELLHITKAAEVLHISQPSLTQAIHFLEDELGVPLFQRSGRRIELTAYGEHLRNRLSLLLPEFDGLRGEMQQLRDTTTKTVKLNILAASTFVINTIVEYKKKNPDVILDFEQNERKYDCDILISTNGLAPDQRKTPTDRCIKKERIYLAVPKDSKYAAMPALDLSMVQNESFVMLSSTRLFGAICNKYCSIAGFTPKILFESDSPTAVQNIISMGAGIAFWPEYSWGRLHNKNLTLVEIGNPTCERDLIIELYNRQPRSVYAADFYRFLIAKI